MVTAADAPAQSLLAAVNGVAPSTAIDGRIRLASVTALRVKTAAEANAAAARVNCTSAERLVCERAASAAARAAQGGGWFEAVRDAGQDAEDKGLE